MLDFAKVAILFLIYLLSDKDKCLWIQYTNITTISVLYSSSTRLKERKKALIYRPKTAKDKDMWVVLLTYSRIGFAKTRFCIALLFAALKEKTRR